MLAEAAGCETPAELAEALGLAAAGELLATELAGAGEVAAGALEAAAGALDGALALPPQALRSRAPETMIVRANPLGTLETLFITILP